MPIQLTEMWNLFQESQIKKFGFQKKNVCPNVEVEINYIIKH